MSSEVQTQIRDESGRQNEEHDCDPQAVLDVLEDGTAREIIECTDTPMTVAELIDECDLATSTAYRKVNRLQDTGVLRQTIRFSSSGKHPKQYERAICDISVSIDNGLEVNCEFH